jgi:hypothetical protein
MSNDTDPNDARRMLVALLRNKNDGPVHGIAKLSARDVLFLITTCAATVMLESIAAQAHYQRDEALAGLDAMHTDMMTRLCAICAREWPESERLHS